MNVPAAVDGRDLGRHFGHGALITALAKPRTDRLFDLGALSLGNQKLTRGRKVHTIKGRHHALCLGIKGLHAVDLIAEQLDTEGIRAHRHVFVDVGIARARRPHVENTAADGELTGSIDKLDTHIPRGYQLLRKCGRFDGRLAVFNTEIGVHKALGRYGIAERRVGGGYHGIVLALKDLRQHL